MEKLDGMRGFVEGGGIEWEMSKLNAWIIEISKVECCCERQPYYTHEKISKKNYFYCWRLHHPPRMLRCSPFFLLFHSSFSEDFFCVTQNLIHTPKIFFFLLQISKLNFLLIFFLFWNFTDTSRNIFLFFLSHVSSHSQSSEEEEKLGAKKHKENLFRLRAELCLTRVKESQMDPFTGKFSYTAVH